MKVGFAGRQFPLIGVPFGDNRMLGLQTKSPRCAISDAPAKASLRAQPPALGGFTRPCCEQVLKQGNTGPFPVYLLRVVGLGLRPSGPRLLAGQP